MSRLSKALMNSNMYVRCFFALFDAELKYSCKSSGEWTAMKFQMVLGWGGPLVHAISQIIQAL